MNKTRRFSILLISLFVFVLCLAVLPLAVSADTITKTVNIAAANKNERGDGYSWANRTDTLTLSGMHVDTDDPYGLRLPKDCVVILEGKNSVKAAKYGVSCSGTVVFKGSGSLTVEAGEIGFYLISQDKTQKIRLIDGKYEITAGTYGVYSDASDFSFVGQSMTVSVTEPGANAIQGRCVNLLGGSFKANAPVNASQALVVNGVSLDIAADRPALSSKNLEIKNIALSDGSEYAGGNTVTAKGLAKFKEYSAVFATLFSMYLVPRFVDFILLAIAVALVTVLIVVPILRKKKKTKELYERLEKEGYRTPKE